MNVTSNQEFRNALLQNLGFHGSADDYSLLYKNPDRPELGQLLHFTREGFYHLEIADYTIPKDFSISFHNAEHLMRFGVVYQGVTEYQLEQSPVSSFTPSSFFVIEEGLKGHQRWKRGQHYHGIEITIMERYFTEVIKPHFPDTLEFDSIARNCTYTYLPIEITTILRKLQSLALENSINPLYLEAKILECIAILLNEVKQTTENAFTHQTDYGTIQIGQSRTLKLTASDVRAIQKAHDIIADQYDSPPSIQTLSKLVFLNEQKLKAGFTKQYHMSIGEYSNHIRMTIAANLLSTSDLSIESIATKVGYHYSANFSRMFRQTNGKTPLQFRKRSKILVNTSTHKGKQV